MLENGPIHYLHTEEGAQEPKEGEPTLLLGTEP